MGKARKYDDKQLQKAVKESYTFADVCRKLNLALVGGNYATLKLRINRNSIDTSHFTCRGWRKGKTATNKKTANEILIKGQPLDYRTKASQLTRALKERNVTYSCNRCGINKWQNIPIVLEVDHIDGQYWNNVLENLQFLCPNCHALKTKGY